VRTSSARSRFFLVTAVIALALFGGCTVIKGTFDTIKALQDAGFSDPKVSTDGPAVRVSVRKDIEPLPDAAKEAAGIVWRELPSRIDSIHVTCHNGFGGQGEYSATREELATAFGQRPPKLDDPIDDRELRNIGLVVLGAFVFGLVVLAAIITVIVVAVRKNRREPAPIPGVPHTESQGPPWTPSA
jgi:hypothetical protein